MRNRTCGAVRRVTLRVFAAITLTACPGWLIAPAGAQCILPPFIPPTGITQDPGETLQPQEHHLMHSSTHLQGTPASEKVAPGIHLPGTGPLANARLGVIVNNVTSNQTLDVLIEYYDPSGNLVGVSTPPTIAAEGHHIEAATPLTGLPWGTVRVVKANDDQPDFVGATIFHTYEIGRLIGAGGGDPTDIDDASEEPEPEPEPEEYEYYQEPHLRRMGAASMQQLQVMQPEKNELFWGPIPVSDMATPIGGSATPLSWDFMNGICPLMMVTNPTPNPITINVLVFDQALNVIASYPRTLNGFASWCEMPIFEFLVNNHGAAIGYDLDLLFYVNSADPIIGQGLMFDFWGENMEFLARFRVGSTMMSNTRASTLISPELVAETTSIATNTLMGIANAALIDIGPVTIEYRDRNGVVTTNTIASFPPFTTLRIGPGSPGYPLNEFAGSVTVRSCQAGLIGWNMKTTEHPGAPWSDEAVEVGLEFELQKAWGEILHGGNGVEPGDLGFVDPGFGLQRKVGPLNVAFRGPDGMTTPLPSYNHVFNNAVSNVNGYFFRFFDGTGTEFSTFQFFSGLRFQDTAFTYIDGLTAPLVVNPTPYGFYSSRYDHVTPGVVGIDAIGGYIYEWPWDPKQDPIVPPPTGVYHGPCDVVGPPPFWCL